MTHGDYAEENIAEVLGPEVHGQALHHASQDSRPQGGDDAEEDDRTSQDSRPQGRSDEEAEDHPAQDSSPEVDREADNRPEEVLRRPEEDHRPEEVHREEDDLQAQEHRSEDHPAEEHSPEVDRSSEHST